MTEMIGGNNGGNGEAKETVEIKDLVIAVRRGEKNLEVLVNTANRPELEVALMRLTHTVFGVFNAMSHDAQKSSKIIQPKNSIMDFARKIRK